jgi:hypothetical protein
VKNGETIHHGQHKVQDYRIEVIGLDEAQTLVATAGNVHLVPVFREAFVNNVRETPIVFDEQNIHFPFILRSLRSRPDEFSVTCSVLQLILM